ncbi:hypothetical protein [uncultured Nocardioides sp.]|uniref:hypothetical protein n=1 Tax=uncultured Nocardioides sp. TaxID=198441 RepID=UPI0026242055|nr:hypothetical protein [uncultured Nocardioides sp.]
MADAKQFAEEVRRVAADTPYMVADETADGFTVHIDVVDAQWWTLMHRKSLKKAFTHLVTVDPTNGTYTVTDRLVTVEWQAGADVAGGVPRPVLRASAGGAQGTVRTISFRREYAFDDQGQYGKVVDYAFDSGEGNRLIDMVGERLGLEKKLNTTAKVGLGFAVLAIGSLALGGIILGILALTGNFP